MKLATKEAKKTNKLLLEYSRKTWRSFISAGVIQIRKDNVSALYRRYILTCSRSYASWSSHPQSSHPFQPSARVDVRCCRRGFACAPIHHSTVGCVIYHREKTSSIDNLLEELARVHANFWIIMPRRVHYASYRRSLRLASLTNLPPSQLLVLRRLSTRCCSYLLRPPILANCTLQLISDTARATE